ncbi:MAG: RsbRD N-terminal domain-containing protein [Nitrospirae bacterium]|nr:RsbRD N-terminal domain-containing protein [Nitrospirota bacterium]MCL5978738.1 RsbRD N-terminal domain-containing protein [Nitrospirota bacterium]
MSFNKLLSEKKPAILKKWFDAILDTYPAETADFLKKQKDRFANPVGSTIYSGMDSLLNSLLNADDPDTISKYLDDIVRIRAVQDFTPSQSLAFVFKLKDAVREEMSGESNAGDFPGELIAFERRVDALALTAFDIYMKCREKIYDLKANELRNMTVKLVERANLIFEARYRDIDLKDLVLEGNKSERGE